MRSVESLSLQLQNLDGKDYGAYQSIIGSYQFDKFQLNIEHIPKDPYAPPGTGVFKACVSREDAGFSDEYCSTRKKCIAFRDFLARRFYVACRKSSRGRRGTGNSGLIAIDEPGQEILDRTSVIICTDRIEVRFFIGLPAKGRKIDARTAMSMLFKELPGIVESSLFAAATDINELEKHIHALEDAEELRKQLPGLGLVSFIADGAILPRASGIDQRPLLEETVVRFKSPDSLKVNVTLPHSGTINGLGIPNGVTLIVGGGYHGKSTLLQAVELGIYNHIPGDGRELCVSLQTAVKVRATSGRSVVKTDISAFINNLPLKQDTTAFSTQNASGSTSQAAFISESIEAGAEVLLMDEDTCAANLMIRDGRMQKLVAREKEPITAYVDRVRQLYRELGVSTILVMGGSGDYFDVADCVVQMMDFMPLDVSGQAKIIADGSAARRDFEGSPDLQLPSIRKPLADGLDPRNDYGHFRISAGDPHNLIFGKHKIDLSDVEQLMEKAQTLAIGRGIEYAKKYMDGNTPIRDIIEKTIADVNEYGLDILDDRQTGNLAAFRSLDLAAALNRFRDLRIN